jgi:hypothetical protein
MIGLNAREGTGHSHGGAVITFTPDGDIEAEVEQLQGKGVEFIGGISDHPWGRIAPFKDSEGNDLQAYARRPDPAAGPGAARDRQDGRMETVQLRHYVIEPGRMADFLAWFPSLLPVREQFGFRVLFALAEHEHETFTWAVAHDGDEAAFLEVEAAYKDSPERATVFETFPACLASTQIGFATPAV